MNREQKSAAIAEIASRIDESDAIFAVDFRGISVAQIADLRARLRDADASFRVVKNSLTERAAAQAGAESLNELLTGPTALTFVRGDAALAAKAVADFARATQLLPFKGGIMDGAPLDVEQVRSLSRLPSRDALYGQLAGVVASPLSGLVRTLNALLGGLAVALGQLREKRESGEIPGGEAAAPAPAATAEQGVAEHAPAEPSAAEQGAAEQAPAEQAPAEQGAAEQAPAEQAPAAAARPAREGERDEQAEPEPARPAQETDKQADASDAAKPGDAEANPTKED